MISYKLYSPYKTIPNILTYLDGKIYLCNNPKNLLYLYKGTIHFEDVDYYKGEPVEWEEYTYCTDRETLLKDPAYINVDIEPSLYEVDYITKSGKFNDINDIHRPIEVNEAILNTFTIDLLKNKNTPVSIAK
jgi:hypothetical protein|nr:MAG TPA: hypothetical protein [Caudoviricetes sp.]